MIGGLAGDKLVEVASGHLEHRASYKVWLSSLVFLLLGPRVMIGFTSFKLKAGGLAFDKNTIIPLVIDLLFALAGVFLLYQCTTPVVFDRRKGLFWKGRKAPDKAAAGTSVTHWAGTCGMRYEEGPRLNRHTGEKDLSVWHESVY